MTSEVMKRQKQIAQVIDHFWNGDEEPAKVGFVLITFDFSDYVGDGVNFVSNVSPEGAMVAMEELMDTLKNANIKKESLQ